ncbi:unnamed protein product [Peronospora farinosa]|uniref:Uncharacterized protein n=1 Tax=Peronospora farinosa TaxID=134698 RepID=A0AAV0UY61_9STRA|nr:unnamed protein product [Peronospora farinosa]CAI5740590.1 unnamed protein product [Peronospora farinosa]
MLRIHDLQPLHMRPDYYAKAAGTLSSLSVIEATDYNEANKTVKRQGKHCYVVQCSLKIRMSMSHGLAKPSVVRTSRSWHCPHPACRTQTFKRDRARACRCADLHASSVNTGLKLALLEISAAFCNVH